jgi:AbrB family looped-hinge helix DNA binding protein
MKSTVGEKGQVTIPKRLRESLGIERGTELEFFEEQGRLVARRVVVMDPFSALVGIIERVDVDATIDSMRGPAWNAETDGGDDGHLDR